MRYSGGAELPVVSRWLVLAVVDPFAAVASGLDRCWGRAQGHLSPAWMGDANQTASRTGIQAPPDLMGVKE